MTGPEGTPAAPAPVVLAATENGRRLAADLAAHLGTEARQGKPRDVIAEAWPQASALVLVMATGAAVRLIAPHLSDKRTDPAVVCVDDIGRFAISLCGGHEGGANALATRIAGHLRATPVVTTASEAADLPSLGSLGERFGVRAEGDLAAVGGHLLSGGKVRVERELAWPLGPVPAPITEDPAAPQLRITDRVAPQTGPTVYYRPPSLVLGIGSSRGVTAAEVGDLIDLALADAGLSPLSVHTAATVDLKADETGINEAAFARGLSIVHLTPDTLAAIEVPNPSEVVRGAVGTPSVAEASALHLGGELLVAKRRSAMATVAIARRPMRGRLALVSLGPGSEDLTVPRAAAELAAAEVVIGYGPYVDQAARWTSRGAVLERFGLGQEVARAERAVELARSGRAVALVGSGDVGIYAMASPTLELAGADIDVAVVPGVTAALASSALLGAPFGHDHCYISLSDLMTPWERIEARVEAAAQADLAIAFYNPRSAGRDWQLGRAREILLRHRDAETPVGIVRDAERPDQEITVTTLGGLDVASVQMTTLVLVGTSRTRTIAGRMVTPRGYRTGTI
ncbi:precorrin-3B C(17)-methyltransferase [Glycomyces buryatensis]|uniref:precorrin-3B C(17)-methyltransferase n=1 Tax=Glycomyces buryatensis TaxID=2570927 RepID=UPI001B3C14AB|nr:precorrin-3B C(17)-methyltransferase [Glycomyces buryatensis]